MLFTELDPITGDSCVKEQDTNGSEERGRFQRERDAQSHALQLAKHEHKEDELDIYVSPGRPKFMGSPK